MRCLTTKLSGRLWIILPVILLWSPVPQQLILWLENSSSPHRRWVLGIRGIEVRGNRNITTGNSFKGCDLDTVNYSQLIVLLTSKLYDLSPLPFPLPPPLYFPWNYSLCWQLKEFFRRLRKHEEPRREIYNCANMMPVPHRPVSPYTRQTPGGWTEGYGWFATATVFHAFISRWRTGSGTGTGTGTRTTVGEWRRGISLFW